MKKFATTPYTPRTEKESALAQAILALETRQEVLNFLRDVLTPTELEEFANRLEIAKLLTKGKPYHEIAEKIGVSTTTVTRVAQWVFFGCGGYETVLKRLSKGKGYRKIK